MINYISIVPLLTPVVAMAADPRFEAVAIIADGTPADTARAAIGETVLKGAPQSLLHVFAARPRHEHIGSITIGSGRAHVRLRSLSKQRGWSSIRRFLAAGGSNLQPNLPEAAATVNSVRRTNQPVFLTVFGDPVYRSVAPDGPSLAEGVVWRDRSLVSDPTCPFANGVSDFPADTRVVLVPPPAWGVDHAHRAGLTRMYSVWLAQHGARLWGVPQNAENLLLPGIPQPYDRQLSADPSRGFLRVSVQPTGSSPAAIAELATAAPPDVAPPSVTQPVAGQTVPPEPEAPSEVTAVLEQAEDDRGIISIAINWASPDETADIDIHVKNAGHHEELNFTKKQTPFGELFRDVTRVGDAGGEVDFDKWECVRIDHNRIEKLEVWLHTYRGTSPSRVRVVAVVDGRRTEEWIDMPRKPLIPLGGRTQANAWKRLTLTRAAR